MKEQLDHFPIVTIFFVVANILIWIVLEVMGSTYDSSFMIMYGASYTPYILENGEWWRLLTCTFLHFGPSHLFSNMLILALTGMRLERHMGKYPFAVLYLLSGISGSVMSFLKTLGEEEAVVSAGASGAVFGILGGLIVAAFFNHGKVEDLKIKGLFIMLVLNIYNGFTTVGVDNWGHIGGFAGGFIFSLMFCLVGKYRND